MVEAWASSCQNMAFKVVLLLKVQPPVAIFLTSFLLLALWVNCFDLRVQKKEMFSNVLKVGSRVWVWKLN